MSFSALQPAEIGHAVASVGMAPGFRDKRGRSRRRAIYFAAGGE
jgi:hypothetical protein